MHGASENTIQQTYTALVWWWAEFNHAPVAREIAERIGKSPCVVNKCFWELERRGMCKPLSRGHRFMALTETPDVSEGLYLLCCHPDCDMPRHVTRGGKTRHLCTDHWREYTASTMRRYKVRKATREAQRGGAA